jgi:SAM-dependent methyltransferase
MPVLAKEAASACRGWVDWSSSEAIVGWADGYNAGEPVYVDVAINGRKVATLSASLFRDDLLRDGIRDGCRGFVFHPAEYLREGINRIVVSHTATGATLSNGEQIIQHKSSAAGPAGRSEADLLAISQLRWKGDEEDAWLTWGTRMTGDSFIDAVVRHHRFSEGDRILEIGPGFGRLLLTIRERRLPFARYLGVELSAARVEKLTKKFADPRVRFVAGDVLAGALEFQTDVVLCSSTFEHLYPSMAPALNHLHQITQAGGKVFIDFIWNDGDENLEISRAYFEYTSAYIRMYSRTELEALFPEAGFRVLAIESVVLGQDRHGKDVRRALVVAERR